MEMEIARLVLEYLRVLLSPQVVSGAVIVFSLVAFRVPVERLIDRIRSVRGPGGTGADFGEQLRTAEEVKPELAKTHELKAGEQLTVTDAGGARTTPAPTDAQQALERLARWWAFEKIYRAIYRSQIDLLRFLERNPDHRASWSELQVFYQQGILAQGVPPQAYPYQNYMTFLANVGLIQWTTPPGAPEAQVTLTPLGDEFLHYLLLSNYNVFERPY